MSLNLIKDPWIPVRRRDGTAATIRPADIADFGADGDNPPVELDAVRPDFDGALIQFLIGLVQTTFAPERERRWPDRFVEPPAVGELHDAFCEVAHAFDLDGDGPRFMQDFEPLEASSTKPISYLLVDTPTGQTLKKNKDHFAKNRDNWRFCPSCAVLSVMTLQLNAPGGGRGYRTSLRGGGPLTTVIEGPNLWKTVWLNILSTRNINGWKTPERTDLSGIFPWVAETRCSDKDGTNTTPVDVHPAQMYWATPRRIDLQPASESEDNCDLCGEISQRLFSDYTRKAYGVNYEGAWEHHLTPHRHDKDNRPNPAKGQLGGLTYRHWEGYVVNSNDGDQRPAKTVQQFWKRADMLRDEVPTFALHPSMWAFGFDADNMKIRSWHDSQMPLFVLEDELRQPFERFSLRLISAADTIAYMLGITLKNGLYGTPSVTSTGKVKWHVADGVTRGAGIFQQSEDQFWQNTEAAFYEALADARNALRSGDSLDDFKTSWADALNGHVLSLFDHATQFGEFHNADPKAVALSRRHLNRASNYRRSSKLQKALAIELDEVIDEDTDDDETQPEKIATSVQPAQ